VRVVALRAVLSLTALPAFRRRACDGSWCATWRHRWPEAHAPSIPLKAARECPLSGVRAGRSLTSIALTSPHLMQLKVSNAGRAPTFGVARMKVSSSPQVSHSGPPISSCSEPSDMVIPPVGWNESRSARVLINRIQNISQPTSGNVWTADGKTTTFQKTTARMRASSGSFFASTKAAYDKFLAPICYPKKRVI